MFAFFSQPSQRFVKRRGIRVTVVHLDVGPSIKWTINSAVGILNAISLLQTVQPVSLDIDIPKDTATPIDLKQLCEVMQQKFTGRLIVKLWHSYLNYKDCSDQVKILLRGR